MASERLDRRPLYAVQIYCDFSGYTDMAIAVARLLGYTLTINFNFPYFASSISDFWRRWHISLSSWLRDYLYISLGGNRGSKLFTYRNILLTMLLGGLWHGASWVFVLWGGLHGLGLIGHRQWSRMREKADHFREGSASGISLPRGGVDILFCVFVLDFLSVRRPAQGFDYPAPVCSIERKRSTDFGSKTLVAPRRVGLCALAKLQKSFRHLVASLARSNFPLRPTALAGPLFFLSSRRNMCRSSTSSFESGCS